MSDYFFTFWGEREECNKFRVAGALTLEPSLGIIIDRYNYLQPLGNEGHYIVSEK